MSELERLRRAPARASEPQMVPGQRSGEQDEQVTTAKRRDVGEDPGAVVLEQPGEFGRLAVDVTAGRRI